MEKLESLIHFLDSRFDPENYPDYPNALNGLQVEGPREIHRVGAAVDASEKTIRLARERGVDLLLVHHGLFWGGLGRLTGPRYRKVTALIQAGMALYSLHLPLDAHPTFGNSALLASELGLKVEGGFAAYEGEHVGWWGRNNTDRAALGAALSAAVDGPVHTIPGGPEKIVRIGVVTGGGAGTMKEAADLGLDALVTGEAAHHHYHEALEVGINLFLAGHYATETFGVKALARHLAREFDVAWEFLDVPTGL
ncbi:Nif3-like dinuclear metal center hexameric protein [Gemmatimonadota bacterium]